MKNKTLTKVLAVIGSVFVVLPILAPIGFSILRLIRSGFFNLDYLMPAELFFLILIGGALLVWAAIRAGVYRRLTGWSLGLAIFFLVAGQTIAVLTGLASGDAEPTGWRWVIVLGSILAFDLVVILLGVAGILLIKFSFKHSD